MKFSHDQHKLWASLLERQIPNVTKFASDIYLEGLERLNLPMDRIPTLTFLNSKIRPLTGWRTLRTKIRYSDSLPWYQHFLSREFIITDYLRSWDEFEYTHEPDMFHDIFGHIPFHTLPQYTEIIELFAPAFLRANESQREDIKKLAWFSYEFGLVREKGKNKIFGTGLMSSIGEIEHVAAGKTPILPYTLENVLKRRKAIYTFNEELFVFESLDALKAELQKYFATIEDTPEAIIKPKRIIDAQMTGIKT